MAIWNRWWRFQRRRNSRMDKISTAAPVNTQLPVIDDGGNGLMIVTKGTWNNLPTKFDIEWKVGGSTVEYGGSYIRPANVNATDVSVSVTASNDNGSTTVTVP